MQIVRLRGSWPKVGTKLKVRDQKAIRGGGYEKDETFNRGADPRAAVGCRDVGRQDGFSVIQLNHENGNLQLYDQSRFRPSPGPEFYWTVHWEHLMWKMF